LSGNFLFTTVFLIILFNSGINFKAFAESSNSLEVFETTNYYIIHGNSVEELNQQRRAHGEPDKDGRRWGGMLNWNIKWSYPYILKTDGCATGPVKVIVNVTYTLPKWEKPEEVSYELAYQWETFSKAIKKHEDGHKNFAVEAGQKILNALSVIPPQPTCKDLDKKANATGKAPKDEARELNKLYDKKTNHGESQGAYLR